MELSCLYDLHVLNVKPLVHIIMSVHPVSAIQGFPQAKHIG